jgi:superfamily II DNA or RNA helicase
VLVSCPTRVDEKAVVRAASAPFGAPFDVPSASGPTGLALRAWQRAALDRYRAASPRDFLAVATPGAGKTTFALRLATELLAAGAVDALTVVCPTDHLKQQWAVAAHAAGIPLDPTFRNADGASSRAYRGVAVTYAQVAAHPALHERRTAARRTLVVLDEIHHAGDALSWGDAIRDAFAPATRRLALTGTPFRSDTNPIPFVPYARDPDGALRSVSDYAYGYGEALRDGVVRPVIFLAYSGETRWRTRAGIEVAARLGEPLTADLLAQAWRTALDPAGEWIAQVLTAADHRLSQVRAGGMPDAGGLVIASDHASARAYAVLLGRRTGSKPVVVLSDDPQASRKIAEFARSDERWMVAVRMVSEGVDVPRLAVGVYATSVSTPLYFAQAVGRFVRARRPGETASVFLPSVPTLLQYAADMEAERDHVLERARPDGDPFAPEDALLAAALRSRDEPGSDEDQRFEALEASASFDRVLYDGAEFGTGSVPEEELDYLGLPGLLAPDQVAELLRQRQAERLAAERADARERAARQPDGGLRPPTPLLTHERLAALRRELSTLVGAHHHRTGKPHGVIHSELRRACGGPPAAQATEADLCARIETLRRWAVSR